MNHTIIAGYYGEKNSGDDALLASALFGVEHLSTHIHPLITATSLPTIDNARAATPLFTPRVPEARALYQAYSTASFVVYGGGSVFHSSDKMARDCDLLDVHEGLGAVAVGVSFGPFRDTAAARVCERLVSKFAYIGCRDEESVELIRSIAPHVAVEQTFDLAPLFLETIPPIVLRKRAGLGLALNHYERYIGDDQNVESARMNEIVKAINALSPEEVEKLVLIDFNGHPVFGDAPIHAELMARVTTKVPIEYVPYNRNPRAALEKIASLRGLIGMRLHSAVFGYLTDTPTIIFSYHPKCDGWAQQIGASPPFTINSKAFTAEELLFRSRQLLDGSFVPPTLSIIEAKKHAMRNWEGAKCALFPS